MSIGIVIFSFALVWLWEFITEPYLGSILLFETYEESLEDKWREVAFSVSLVSIAIILPLLYILHTEKLRNKVNDELNQIFDLSPDMICSGTVDGYFLRVNSSFKKILGYDEREMIGTSFFEYIHPDDRAKTMESIKKTFTGSGINLIENRYICKDGSIKWISWSTQILQEEGHFFGVGRDITEWKKVERDLLVKNYAIDSSIHAIAMADPVGTITYVNDKLLEMFRYDSAEELIGKNTEVFKSDEWEEVPIIKILREHGEWSGEMISARKDGSSFSAQVYANTVKDGNQDMVCMMGSLVDITDKKRADEELMIAKTRAEEARNEKERYISLIAQDLKTPFTSLVLLLQLVMTDNEVNLPDEYKERFKSSIVEVDQAVRLINEVIHASQFQTGQIKLKKSFFDGNEVAFQVAANFGHLAEEKGIRLVNNVPERTRLYGDPALYTEILQNIISNAIKYSNKGARVTIFALNNEPATIAVSDNGTGISESFQNDIFRHDVRTSKVGTIGERGSGFGLPISKDIIEAHGGALRFETEADKGTTFYIGLPEVTPEVLVVDNDEVSISAIRKILPKYNIDVRLTWGGAEALAAIKEKKPHLIICDTNLSDIDYGKFITTIKNNPETANIPLLVMDRGEDYNIFEKIKPIQQRDVVRKPLQEGKLVKQVLDYIV